MKLLKIVDNFAEKIVVIVENFLNKRYEKKNKKRERAKKRKYGLNLTLDFLSAAVFVLLINQYFIQAYQIPSGSMEETLKVGDFLFVDKFSYGPELLPGFFKIKGLSSPNPGDIIIFENPEYIGRGTIFDIFQRLLYMLTLSLVDIDRDENGKPKVRFLVKRALASDGRIVKFMNGSFYTRGEGEDKFLNEEAYKDYYNLQYETKKLVTPLMYENYTRLSHTMALKQLGANYNEDLSYLNSSAMDFNELLRREYKFLYAFLPTVNYYKRMAVLKNFGMYVPYDYVIPIGDNRDNSHDGRMFGVISKNKILGKTLLRYFPFSRFGKM